MMTFKTDQFWINGPRALVTLMLSYSIFEKLLNPSTFYIIINSLNIHVNAPEFILSLLITIEMALVCMLIFKPNHGIIYSASYFMLFTGLIGVLHIIGIRELCRNDEVISQVLGLAKILQNLGAALLLFSSWSLRKKLLS
ncbi:MAG: MauE/DoxX family redox-associated membrane protein [Balneolaceae bacterium]